MNWAWSQELAPSLKLILMALADCAGDDDKCWPSVGKVAKKCCVSERTVQRVTQQFVVAGLLKIEERFDQKSGRRKSNSYLLNIGQSSHPDNLSPSKTKRNGTGDKLSGTGATADVRGDGDIAMSPLEPPKESAYEPPLPRLDAGRVQALIWPEGLSLVELDSIRNLLMGIEQSKAQILIDELADALRCKTIKTTPPRWFRGVIAKYRQGDFQSTGGVQIAERRRQIADLDLKRKQSEIDMQRELDAALMAMSDEQFEAAYLDIPVRIKSRLAKRRMVLGTSWSQS